MEWQLDNEVTSIYFTCIKKCDTEQRPILNKRKIRIKEQILINIKEQSNELF